MHSVFFLQNTIFRLCCGPTCLFIMFILEESRKKVEKMSVCAFHLISLKSLNWPLQIDGNEFDEFVELKWNEKYEKKGKK